jgi:hypothetical protein
MRGELHARDAVQAARLVAGVLRVAGENPTVAKATAMAACISRCRTVRFLEEVWASRSP